MNADAAHGSVCSMLGIFTLCVSMYLPLRTIHLKTLNSSYLKTIFVTRCFDFKVLTIGYCMMLLLEENTFKCENLLLDTALIIIFISGLIGKKPRESFETRHVSISFVSLSSL